MPTTAAPAVRDDIAPPGSGLGLRLRKWLGRTAAAVYGAIRPRLPDADYARYAGVPVAIRLKRFDTLVPARVKPTGAEHIPDYEASLVTGLRRHVRAGDHVVVVGGGIGVTAVVAAQLARPGGRVTCYEGASEGVAKTRATVGINGLDAAVTVVHAVVARSVAVYGTEPETTPVDPADLPACDVLELDCEGAETDILAQMTIRPRAVLVETHGLYGAPTARVVEQLQALGYTTDVIGPAEPRVAAFCRDNDIMVVAAARQA